MTYEYVGTELDLFAQATNWKKYLQSVVSPFLTGDVLEVGAGIGTTTRAFSDGSASTWLCLEPDGDLAARASPKSLEARRAPRRDRPGASVAVFRIRRSRGTLQALLTRKPAGGGSPGHGSGHAALYGRALRGSLCSEPSPALCVHADGRPDQDLGLGRSAAFQARESSAFLARGQIRGRGVAPALARGLPRRHPPTGALLRT